MKQEAMLGRSARSVRYGRYPDNAPVRPRTTHNFLRNLIACLTISPAGFNLALPGANSGAAWAAPFEVFHGVFIHNVMTLTLFVVSIALICTGQLRTVISRRVWRYAGLITALATAGLVST